MAVSASQGALGSVDLVEHPHHQIPAQICCCCLSQPPNVSTGTGQQVLCTRSHFPGSCPALDPLSHISNHSIKHSFPQQILGDFSERFSYCLKKLPCSLTFNKAIRKKKKKKKELILLNSTVTHLEVRKLFELLCATAAASLHGCVLLSHCPGRVCLCAGSVWEGFGSRGSRSGFCEKLL